MCIRDSFLSDAINSPTQNIRYDKDTFTTGQISSGFLFEADQIIINDKTFQPMGGVEFYYDMSRNIDYNYSLVGSNQVNTDTIDGAYKTAANPLSGVAIHRFSVKYGHPCV